MISAVDGAAGIGKTALTVHWAHRVQHRFPGGTLYTNMRGYGPGMPMPPLDALDGFLRALGVPAESIPVEAEARAALYRSVLTGRQVLIVLDNVNSADQVRPLLPAAPGCMVVVTSRHSLTGLVVIESAHRLTLDLLTEPEALELVTRIIGSARIAAERDVIDELIRLCARLPLALRIAASRVAAHPRHTVAEVVADLADEDSRLDTLSRDGDERAAVRAVFDWSYQRLPADQARMFRRVGLHPGPDLSEHAAAVLADVDPSKARQLLDRLADAHLVEPVGAGRYRLHDLLRAYAADQARRQDSPAIRDVAVLSLLTWYAHTAHICHARAFPGFYRLALRIESPARPQSITSRPQALDWLENEEASLIAAVNLSDQKRLHQHVIHLAESARFLTWLGAWDRQLAAFEMGVSASRRCGDRVAEAWLQTLHGEALRYRRCDDALAALTQACAIARELGDHFLLAAALNALGLVFHEQKRFEEAMRHFLQALPLSHGIDSGRQEAVLEYNLSRACTALGRHREAVDHAERSVTLRRRSGDTVGEIATLCELARAWQGQRNHPKTIALCRDAIALSPRIRSLGSILADLFDTLAVSLHHTGETSEAVSRWREALAIYEDCGRPGRATQVRERLDQVTSA